MLMKSASWIRWELHKVERGICTACGLDTTQLLSDINCLPRSRRLDWILKAAPKWGATAKSRGAAERLAKHPTPGEHVPRTACSVLHLRSLFFACNDCAHAL